MKLIPVKISSLFLAIPLLFPLVLPAGAEEEDTILEESGIHYPGGYDPNTVGEIRGKVFNLSRPEYGPIRLQLETNQEIYTVLTSPPWYWKEIRPGIVQGTDVIVRGSKSFGRDGRLYIIAQEIFIPSSGRSLLLRGKDGIPLWKSSGRAEKRTWPGHGSPPNVNRGFGQGGAGGRDGR
jgi:hypothetical protein